MAPQALRLLIGQFKHEIGRESVDIAFDRPVQRLRFHLIELGQVRIQNDLLPADQQDGARDPLDWNRDIPGPCAGVLALE